MTINALGIIPIKTDSCPAFWNHAKKLGMTVKKGSQKPGDLVLYDFNGNGTPDHIGIVVQVLKNSIKAVEGNTGIGNDTNGGEVLVRERKTKILGYVRPKYNKTVTASMIVQTALSQVGVKESPANSNKVKYNVWFYGRNLGAPWCCTFACWNFGNVMEVKAVDKPTGTYTGKLVNKTVKRGSEGDHVKAVQRFLNWYHPDWKLTIDGDCGNHTVQAIMSYQKTEGLTVDGEFGPKCRERAETYMTKKTTKPTNTSTPAKKPAKPAKKGYGGTFPELNNNAKIINGLAFYQCWPYGTKKDKYTYAKGKPIKAYTAGIDKAYPKHKDWPNKKQRVGACCDVFVGECLGNVGIKVPKDLKNQLKQMPKMKNQLRSNGHFKAADFKAGDIVQRGRKDYSGHTFVIAFVYRLETVTDKKTGKKTTKVRATKYIANSHYKKYGGTYAVMDSKATTQKPDKWKYYKCYTPLGAIRNYYRLGDYGLDVYRIQKFLKWAGYYKGVLGFKFDAKTEAAVKAFQKAHKLKQSGHVGPDTIKAMKAERR